MIGIKSKELAETKVQVRRYLKDLSMLEALPPAVDNLLEKFFVSFRSSLLLASLTGEEDAGLHTQMYQAVLKGLTDVEAEVEKGQPLSKEDQDLLISGLKSAAQKLYFQAYASGPEAVAYAGVESEDLLRYRAFLEEAYTELKNNKPAVKDEQTLKGIALSEIFDAQRLELAEKIKSTIDPAAFVSPIKSELAKQAQFRFKTEEDENKQVRTDLENSLFTDSKNSSMGSESDLSSEIDMTELTPDCKAFISKFQAKFSSLNVPETNIVKAYYHLAAEYNKASRKFFVIMDATDLIKSNIQLNKGQEALLNEHLESVFLNKHSVEIKNTSILSVFKEKFSSLISTKPAKSVLVKDPNENQKAPKQVAQEKNATTFYDNSNMETSKAVSKNIASQAKNLRF